MEVQQIVIFIENTEIHVLLYSDDLVLYKFLEFIKSVALGNRNNRVFCRFCDRPRCSNWLRGVLSFPTRTFSLCFRIQFWAWFYAFILYLFCCPSQAEDSRRVDPQSYPMSINKIQKNERQEASDAELNSRFKGTVRGCWCSGFLIFVTFFRKGKTEKLNHSFWHI